MTQIVMTHTKLLLLVLLLVVANSSASAFQKRGGRDLPTPAPAPAPTPKPKGPGVGSGSKVNHPQPQPQFANLPILAPAGCRVWINETELDGTKPTGTLMINQQRVKTAYSSGSGTVTLRGLSPGSYRIAARKQDFQEYSQVADVFLDRENVFSIVMDPLPAKLTISPSIGGAEVEVLNLDTGRSLGRYFHKLDQVELTPGRYRVTTSKSGYRPSMREVTARAGESIYLEPSLEPLPTPTPTPIPTPIQRNAPITFDVQRQDKFFILRLQGSSGDAARTVGSINVTLGGPASNYVTGNLNGLPCRVEFIKLENIAEGSVVEAPGPSNNWSTIVVRVRPKDEKRRPISFAINWNSLAQPGLPGSNSTPSVLVPAVVMQRVQPNFPPEARGSAISGTVLVTLMIDSMGSVISAKAIEGPYVFRRVSEEAARKWKFRPATRDGRSVESEQIIQFKFER